MSNGLCKEVQILALPCTSPVYSHNPRSIGLLMVCTALFLFRLEFHLVTRLVKLSGTAYLLLLFSFQILCLWCDRRRFRTSHLSIFLRSLEFVSVSRSFS